MAFQIIRKNDPYICALPKHMGMGTVNSGCSKNVLVEGREVATLDAACRCLGGQPAYFVTGNTSILVNGKPIITATSITDHGGLPISGSTTVLAG